MRWLGEIGGVKCVGGWFDPLGTTEATYLGAGRPWHPDPCNRPYGEAQQGAAATMTAILGRMATYSGQRVTWDEAMASDLQLVPDDLTDFSSPPPVLPDKDGRYPVAVPGVSKPYENWYA